MAPIRFLLIGAHGNFWQRVLAQAVQPFGSLAATEVDDLLPSTAAQYDFVVVDAAFVENVPAVIRQVRRGNPQARVLVITLSPTWKRARDALKAGAVDYIKKSLDVAKVREEVQSALDKIPPP
jgi:DNA-binding NtrC family response regulator